MKSAFNRYRLVDEDDFQRQKEKQLRDFNPELRSQVRKETSLTETIDDSNLSAELKLLLIRLLNRTIKPIEKTERPHSKPKDVTIAFEQPEFKTEIPLPTQEDVPQFVDLGGVGGGEEEEVAIPIEEIATQVPLPFRKKASELAKLLSADQDFVRVNEKNELVINGDRVPNSNANMMFKYLYSARKTVGAPIGYAKFIRALAELKVPLQLISNKNVQLYLRDAYQSGQGKRLPKPIGFAKRPIHSIKKPIRKRAHTTSTSLKSLNLYKI